DLHWRVQSLLKKHGDSQRLSYEQRFRFNSMQQKYAIFSDLWRKKVNIRQEGFPRPQDQLLAIQGPRTEQEHAAATAEAAKPKSADWQPLKIKIADPTAERDHVRTLFDAITTARLHARETAPPATFDSFATFVQKKTNELRTKYHCPTVEYEVEMKDGKVKLVARPKK